MACGLPLAPSALIVVTGLPPLLSSSIKEGTARALPVAAAARD